MFKIRQKKFIAVILTFAMLVGVLPSMTLPAYAVTGFTMDTGTTSITGNILTLTSGSVSIRLTAPNGIWQIHNDADDFLNTAMTGNYAYVQTTNPAASITLSADMDNDGIYDDAFKLNSLRFADGSMWGGDFTFKPNGSTTGAEVSDPGTTAEYKDFIPTNPANFDGITSLDIVLCDDSDQIFLDDLVIDVPTATGPTFTSGTTASYAENATVAAYTAAATASSGGGTVAYSITGGADQAKFNINSSTGVVTFKGSPDYENPTDTGANNVYNITVTATDSHGSASQNVAITVADINDVNFSTGDNANIVSTSSLVKSVTAGNTADITFTGAGYLNVEHAGTFTSNGGGTLPDGLYAWAGISGDNTVSLVITAQPGYTFDLSSFKYVNDPDRSVSNVSVAFTSGGTSYNDDYTVSEHIGKWTTINSFAHAVNDVTQVALSASDYTLFQDIEITDIKPIPLSSDATLASVLSQTITAGSEAGASGAPKTASISVANTVSTIALGDIVKHDTGATVIFYGTNSTFSTPEAGNVSLTAGSGTDVYIKVVAADSTTLYYKVTVTRAAAAPTTYTLNYTAGANGTLTGTASQTVNEGSDGTMVTAVPNTGYHFVDWSDGNTNATRTDTNVAGNISVTANFALNPPTATGGVEYVDVTNVLSGATLKLYTTDGALISSTYRDMGSGTYRFENVLPNSKWFYVTQTAGGEESVNSSFVNVTFRTPVATDGVEYVDVSNVTTGATIKLYRKNDGGDVLVSSSPVSLGGGKFRFENVTPYNVGFYVIQSANGVDSANSPFVYVGLRTPVITGENKQITVSDVFTDATVSLYNSSGNLVTALSNVTGGTCQFTTVTPGSGYYVKQSINGVQSDVSNTATVYAAAPVFVGGTSSITARQNANATDISDQFYVNDIDVGQTLTWSVVSGPSHGTLSGFPATGSTNGAGGIYGTAGSKDTRIPTPVTYTPAIGYTGADSFTIQVSDGVATDTRTITVEVIQSPGSTVTAATSAELMAAINNAAVSTINLNAGTTYQISGAEINRPLSINGNGAVIEALYGVGQSFDNQTIYHLGKPDGDGNRRYRGNIFWYVKTGGTLTIQNLTLRNAATTENAQGLTGIFAAILANNSGNLSLTGVSFENFWFKNSKFMELNNLAEAQGLYEAYSDMSYGVYADYNCTGNIAVSGCTFGSTNAFRDAVHIYNGSSVTIQNSTFTGTVHPERLRSADGYEYGIYLYGGNCTVKNNTITGYDSKTLVGYASGGIALIPFNNGSIEITGNTISGNDAGVDLTGGWKNLEPSMVLSFNGVSMNSSDNGFIIGENLKATNTISGNSTANIVMHLDQDDDAKAVVYYSQLLTVTGTNTLTPTLSFAANASGLIQSANALAIEKSEDNGLNWATASIDGTLGNSSTSIVVNLQPGKTYKLRLKMTHDSKQSPNTVVTGYSDSIEFSTPAQYTLAYTAGTHGTLSGTTSQAVLSGGNGTAVTAVPNTGYHFVKWSDDVTTASRTDSNVTGNISVTAVFAINSYTLAYTAGSNGTLTGTASQSVNHGTSGSQVTAVPNTGYHFVKWSDDVTTASRTDSNVAGNISVTATFAMNSYTVSFNVDGGSAVGSQSINYNAKATRPADPTKTGYTFDGWYKDGAFETAHNFDTDVITADTTIYAKWNINSYTVSFNVDGGSAVDSQSINYNAKATKPADPTKTGYTFAGWYNSNTLTTEFDFANTAITTGTAIYAKWNINSYTVSFNMDGGSAVNSQNVNYNAKATKPADPTKTGYTFGGWYADSTFGTLFSFDTAIKAATTVFAKWNPVASNQEQQSGAVVLVNGKSENIGTGTTSQEGDKTVTTVTIDQKKLEEKLEAEGQKAVVTIPVNDKSDVVVGELNGQMVKNMENKQAVLEVKTEKVSYTLPAQQIKIDDVSQKLGSEVELKDIKVQVEIADPTADTVKVVENSAKKGEFTIVAAPVEFTVKCKYEGKTVEISSFNSYVERMVAIPEGIDPSKITTGIVVEADGTVRHVPTKITIIDGKYYAKINSLTNSTYSVVWHPLEFTDVADHWAKDAVNDMGSRMVVGGVGNGLYAPDRDITRAEFAAIIVKALGLKPGTGNNPFSDIENAEWYADFIETAYAHGIISGYGNGNFGPQDKITREQAMTMIAKAMNITGLKIDLSNSDLENILAGYTDSDKVISWAKESIAKCIKSGIVSGRSGNVIDPKDNITRAEVAVIVRKLLQKSNLI